MGGGHWMCETLLILPLRLSDTLALHKMLSQKAFSLNILKAFLNCLLASWVVLEEKQQWNSDSWLVVWACFFPSVWEILRSSVCSSVVGFLLMCLGVVLFPSIVVVSPEQSRDSCLYILGNKCSVIISLITFSLLFFLFLLSVILVLNFLDWTSNFLTFSLLISNTCLFFFFLEIWLSFHLVFLLRLLFLLSSFLIS